MAIGAAQVGMFGTAESEGASRELATIGRASEWLNSPRLTPASLTGKVVLANFCTYTCINWLRTLPYVRAWAQKYQARPRRDRHPYAGVRVQNSTSITCAVRYRSVRIDYPIVFRQRLLNLACLQEPLWPAL